MQTIVEPKQNVDKLWGKQRVKEDKVFRLMKYVLRVDHEGKVLLHNVVTGRLVVLDQNEAEMLEQLPAVYSPVMEQLTIEHYLVPEDYDEHQQVKNLRKILWKLSDAQKPKEVTQYLILPTTACNARCWYCFEKGITPATMTEKTAYDVVEFIARNCGEKPVRLWWFGGEPTLAANRIDQICKGLQRKGIQYFSDMTTNGYLFDDDTIIRAKKIWNLKQVSFSLDGTEAIYNHVKDFQDVTDNPYKRMMRNADKFLEKGIAVALRMNFDKENYENFTELLNEAKNRFPKGAPLIVYPHQINMAYSEVERSEAEAWFSQMVTRLLDQARKAGLYDKKTNDLPSLAYEMCGAANGKCYVITPKGDLVCCGEQLEDSQTIGNIQQGVTEWLKVKSWQEFADYNKCSTCVLFPRCARIQNCSIKDWCCHKNSTLKDITGLVHRLCSA